MKIKYLGTAASEGNPNPFCLSNHDSKRLRACAMINQDLLIDFGPDLLASCQKLEVNLAGLKLLLITHSHEDHLFFHNFGLRLVSFNDNYVDMPELAIVTCRGIAERIESLSFFKEMRAVLLPITAFERVFVEGYGITAIPANHPGPFGDSFLYIIERDGKSIFYATDTGVFEDDTLKKIAECIERPLNLVVMDATLVEPDPGFKYHHCVADFATDIDRMRRFGIIDEETVVTAHHFSHKASTEAVQQEYVKMGFQVSYDGLEQEV